MNHPFCLVIALIPLVATTAAADVSFTRLAKLFEEPHGRQHPPGVSTGLFLQEDALLLVRPRSNPPTVHRSPLAAPFNSCSPSEFEFSQVTTLAPSENSMLGSIFSFAASDDEFLFLALDKEFKTVVSAISRESLDLVHSSRLPIDFRGGSELKVIGNTAYIYGSSNADGAGLVVCDLRERNFLVKSYSFGRGNAVITDVGLGSDGQLFVAGIDLGTMTPQAPFNAPDAKVFAAKLEADSLELQSWVSFPGQVGPYFTPTLALSPTGTRLGVVFDKETTVEKFHIALAVINPDFSMVSEQVDLTDLEEFGSIGPGRASSLAISAESLGIVIGLPTGSIQGIAYDWETNSISSRKRFPEQSEVAHYVGASISTSMIAGSPVWIIDQLDQSGVFVPHIFTFCPEVIN